MFGWLEDWLFALLWWYSLVARIWSSSIPDANNPNSTGGTSLWHNLADSFPSQHHSKWNSASGVCCECRMLRMVQGHRFLWTFKQKMYLSVLDRDRLLGQGLIYLPRHVDIPGWQPFAGLFVQHKGSQTFEGNFVQNASVDYPAYNISGQYHFPCHNHVSDLIHIMPSRLLAFSPHNMRVRPCKNFLHLSGLLVVYVSAVFPRLFLCTRDTVHRYVFASSAVIFLSSHHRLSAL